MRNVRRSHGAGMRLLGALLALVMVGGFLPARAAAEEVPATNWQIVDAGREDATSYDDVHLTKEITATGVENEFDVHIAVGAHVRLVTKSGTLTQILSFSGEGQNVFYYGQQGQGSGNYPDPVPGEDHGGSGAVLDADPDLITNGKGKNTYTIHIMYTIYLALKRVVMDETGNPIIGEDGKSVKEWVRDSTTNEIIRKSITISKGEIGEPAVFEGLASGDYNVYEMAGESGEATLDDTVVISSEGKDIHVVNVAGSNDADLRNTATADITFTNTYKLADGTTQFSAQKKWTNYSGTKEISAPNEARRRYKNLFLGYKKR